jgi:hypothetical protein
MTVFRTMIETTLAEVGSYVRNQESVTVLTQPIDSDDLTLTLDDVTAVSKGTVEVGDELLYIKKVSSQSGNALVMPGGRGWQGTTPQAHDALTLVRNNPLFPRSQVRRALNDTITGIDLMAISSHEFMFDGTTLAYPLPADFETVTGVSWEAPDSTLIWPLIKHYRVDRNYRVPGDPNPRSALVLHDVPMVGQTVRVQYVKNPAALGDDENFSVTGLPASSEDVIRLGAMWRLLTTVDPGKVLAVSPASEMVDGAVQAGQPTAVARYLYQLFSVRLAEEKSKQMDNYMSVIQYQR